MKTTSLSRQAAGRAGRRKDRRDFAARVSGAEAGAAEARARHGAARGKGARRSPSNWALTASTDNRAAVHDADIILLAVKPQAVNEVLEEIKPEMKPGKLIVSVVASVSTQLMEKHLGMDCPWCAPCRIRPARLVAA